MKNPNFLSAFTLFMMACMLSSCEAIAGIFKAGMGFGIFLVVGVIVLIIVLFMRMGKNKN